MNPLLSSKDLNTITAPFNYMRTLIFKAQLINTFSATVNQMFGGSSQFLTTAEHSSDNIVRSREEPPSISLTVAKNAFVG